jgi:hypothetical protein
VATALRAPIVEATYERLMRQAQHVTDSMARRAEREDEDVLIPENLCQITAIDADRGTIVRALDPSLAARLAERWSGTASDLAPESALLYANRALLLTELGRRAEAVADLRRSVKRGLPELTCGLGDDPFVLRLTVGMATVRISTLKAGRYRLVDDDSSSASRTG